MTLASSPIIHHPFQFGIAGYELTGFGIAVLLAFLIAQIVSRARAGAARARRRGGRRG